MMDRRILFLGQKPVGEKCFDILLQNQAPNFSVCGAVSNADQDCWWGSAEIYMAARREGIPFIENRERHNEEILQLITQEGINTLISVQHAWIIPDSILRAVDGQAFNLHMAKLPEYKGYNTFSFAIINGEKEYTTTIHWMAPQVDAGDIIFEGKIPIAPTETAGTLYEKAVDTSISYFGKFVALLKTDTPIPSTPLTGTPRFYGRDALDGIKEIKDFSDLAYVDRVIRGCSFQNFQGAYFMANGRKYGFRPEEK